MIELLDGLPPHVVGFRGDGRIDAADYEQVLEPAVDAALADGGKVSLLYVLDEGTSYTGGAMWEDGRGGRGPLRHGDRLAVVTDAEWCRRLVHAFGWMMGGQLRLFHAGEVGEATTWASGG